MIDNSIINNKVREKLVKVLAEIDDIKKFGVREKDFNKIEEHLLIAISIINSNSPN